MFTKLRAWKQRKTVKRERREYELRAIAENLVPHNVKVVNEQFANNVTGVNGEWRGLRIVSSDYKDNAIGALFHQDGAVVKIDKSLIADPHPIKPLTTETNE